ncbi:MAG: hypothetical protein JWO53_427 [Chlamydiia bacterium]|nr:hypothetical protein [Chlamydiia bacterium]
MNGIDNNLNFPGEEWDPQDQELFDIFNAASPGLPSDDLFQGDASAQLIRNLFAQAMAESSEKPAEVTKSIEADAIAEKLRVIRQAVDEGKAVEITMLFLSTLEIEIRTLWNQPGQSKKGHEFFATFEGLYERVTMAHVEATAPVTKPLIGPINSLQEEAETHSAGFIRTGLEKLDSAFEMRSIRADGHCLFRSTLSFLLEHLLTLPFSQRAKGLRRLEDKVAAFSKPSLTEKFQFFKQIFEKAVTTGQFFDEIVGDKIVSDKLVAFLRELVCEYHRSSKNEVFASVVALSRQTLDGYLQKMMNMEVPEYGDHVEVEALAQLLGFNFCVVDVAQYGKLAGTEKSGNAFHHFIGHEGIIDYYLMHHSTHYYIGLLRNRQRPRGLRAFLNHVKETQVVKP